MKANMKRQVGFRLLINTTPLAQGWVFGCSVSRNIRTELKSWVQLHMEDEDVSSISFVKVESTSVIISSIAMLLYYDIFFFAGCFTVLWCLSIIVLSWDLVFSTFFLPKTREFSICFENFAESGEWPSSFLKILFPNKKHSTYHFYGDFIKQFLILKIVLFLREHM